MEYLEDASKTTLVDNNVPKENVIVFPHRIAPEKQPDIFRDLANSLPQYEWIVCQDQQLTKPEYHAILKRAKMVFSANLQETLGISPYEGALVGALPLVPDRLSYSEMYSWEFKYNTAWTIDWGNYIQHKPKLVNLIKYKMDNYKDLYPSVVDEAYKLSQNFFSCKPLLENLAHDKL